MARAERRPRLMVATITGLQRLAMFFDRLASRGSAGLGTYIVAGDPDLTTTAKLLEALPSAGADLVELGFPFSDPLAEGPAIQEGHSRALRAGTGLADVFDLVRQWRTMDQQTPLLMMGYLNPILQYGPWEFVDEAADCGVDGFIIVDLPYESSQLLQDPASARGLATVLIVAPSTSDERAKLIAESSTGFLYCAATSGTTGSQRIDADLTRERVARLRTITDKPIGVGFGIQSAADVRAVREFADLAIVGSVVVREIGRAANSGSVDAAVRLTQELSDSDTCPAMSKA